MNDKTATEETNDKTKARLELWKWILGSVVVVLVPPLVTAVFQLFELQHQKLIEDNKLAVEREIQRAKIEITRSDNIQKFLTSQVDLATSGTIEERRRFAQFFQLLAPTDEMRVGFGAYLTSLAEEAQKQLEAKSELSGNLSQSDSEEVVRLTAEIRKLEQIKLRNALIPLWLWWSNSRRDNNAVSTPKGNKDNIDAGYVRVRAEACIFGLPAPDRVPLRLYWSHQRQENFSTSTAEGAKDSEDAGYRYVRDEGFIYPTQIKDTVALKLFWSGSRQDNMVTATPEGEKDALDAGYTFVRIEGYVYPPNTCQ